MASLFHPIKLGILGAVLGTSLIGYWAVTGGEHQAATQAPQAAGSSFNEQLAEIVFGGMLECMSGPDRFASGALARCGAVVKDRAIAAGGKAALVDQLITDVSRQLSSQLNLGPATLEPLDALRESTLITTVRESLRRCARESVLPTVAACADEAKSAAVESGFSTAWADFAVDRVREEWRAAADKIDEARNQ